MFNNYHANAYQWVEHVRQNRKILYHFAISAKFFEILINLEICALIQLLSSPCHVAAHGSEMSVCDILASEQARSGRLKPLLYQGTFLNLLISQLISHVLPTGKSARWHGNYQILCYIFIHIQIYIYLELIYIHIFRIN